jgi:predicted MarR family transcription regulator
LANYALKKLAEHGFVIIGRKGKEKAVSITAEGATPCQRYGEVRDLLLVQTAY